MANCTVQSFINDNGDLACDKEKEMADSVADAISENVPDAGEAPASSAADNEMADSPASGAEKQEL